MKQFRYNFAFFKNTVCILTVVSVFFMFPKGLDAKIFRLGHGDISLKKEVNRSFKMGYDYLEKHQNLDGSWSNPEFPALTGLVIHAFLRSPKYADMKEYPDFIKKGLNFIIKNARKNGGIYKDALPSYNTAVCLMALMAAAKDPKYHPYIIGGRRFLVSLQKDAGKKGVADSLYDGGIGYGSKDHSDMSNTYMALEALKMTQVFESDRYLKRYRELRALQKTSLNWDAALKFIERCQNLPGYNDQSWASDDPKNKGGFVYYPGNSKAGEETLKNGKLALRSYGSMTYAGMLSLIYADLKKDDPRVKAAYEWIKKNYTLDQNPGMNQQGLYYYYHTLAKALTVYGENYLKTADGRKIDWRKDLTIKLVGQQKGEGFWVNNSGRWWENDPILVTAYALIALNMITSSP